jgi:hypothetical protein
MRIIGKSPSGLLRLRMGPKSRAGWGGAEIDSPVRFLGDDGVWAAGPDAHSGSVEVLLDLMASGPGVGLHQLCGGQLQQGI